MTTNIYSLKEIHAIGSEIIDATDERTDDGLFWISWALLIQSSQAELKRSGDTVDMHLSSKIGINSFHGFRENNVCAIAQSRDKNFAKNLALKIYFI